ncbi:replication protein A 70 kDa DNA-binding subunit B-like [Lycium ferocissimum]|uniref:replication protein A 70 kDa DNA-binding subunit B-like n=1 Tax=Lycium ferocissimum TaxID=112874 RepID=UPI00281606E4|nr:replication protein A 70 kDa DNA-binding subunit B-like [Lycium ferocissimum]XP_059289887.1 replication protein A 70 kDa DNA-binding subunit B-like [Lycium ferocissimum]XP_059289888.1 replication protein A 70 kDa DNA-binding subunit B-like [Lycium ferocissimum]XP_059289889.1 replication protein A 70 kDa DNA-binding subunit B-like [Lycium ferocissimum]
MKAKKIDISLMPSRLMRTARKVKISDILDGSLTNVKDMYYKFNAKISGIDNNNGPWYHACKKCYRRVTVIESAAISCDYCSGEDIDYEERYRLKFDVTTEEQSLSITLFDAAQFVFGCDVKEYVCSTSVKKEDSGYYRKLVLSKGKEFSILVKIDRNFATGDSKMNLIAPEIHEVEKLIAAYESDVETLIKKTKDQEDQEG